MIGINKKYYFLSILLAVALCLAQVNGSTLQIMLSLGAIMIMMFIGVWYDYVIPLLLFFLPWSPLMRMSPDNFSFYTVALMLACAIGSFKRYRCFERYHITYGIYLMIISLVSKIIDGNFPALNYFTFLILLFTFPVIKKETMDQRYSFYDLLLFFSTGIIIAAFASMQYAKYGNISQFIRVDSYTNIVRRCGFYGDPNFYVAQITAAIGGCMVMFVEKGIKKNGLVVAVMLGLLTYCGFLSGSKSFVLIAGSMLGVWIISFFRLKGSYSYKLIAIILISVFVVYILTSSLFEGLLKVVTVRLTFGADIDSFTTGRTKLWKMYIDTLLTNFKVLLIGRGYTEVNISGRASHSSIIQAIYQFGLVGAPLLCGWMWCFFRDARIAINKAKLAAGTLLILVIGIFGPWLAIDILFFDEFFLLQAYYIIGIEALYRAKIQEQIV